MTYGSLKSTAEITNFVQETSTREYDAALGEQAFRENYIKMTRLIMSCKEIFGVCYTQLYDVEQKQNGFVT